MLKLQLENAPTDVSDRSGRMPWRSEDAREVLEAEDAHDPKRLSQKNRAKAAEGWSKAEQFNGGTARTVGGILPPDFKAVPAELRSLPRWVVWKGPKVPYCATASDSKASVTAPSTWATFEQSQTAFKKGSYLGVGFVLSGDGIVGVDLDKCVHAGEPEPAALALLNRIGCKYIELSPSGTGLRGFGYGDNIKGRRGQLDGVNVELYTSKRYLTVTGRPFLSGPLVHLKGFSEVADAISSPDLQKSTEDDQSNILLSSVGIPPSTLPTQEGQRNRCVFELARYLRGTFPQASSHEMRGIVTQWHRLALPVIRTKDFAITWADFLNGWKKVRQPYGMTMQAITAGLDHTTPLPPGVKALGYGAAGQHLVRLCLAMQVHHGANPFFISAREAGKLLNVHFTDAAKILTALVADGVLSLISKGAGKLASRYRFTGVDLEGFVAGAGSGDEPVALSQTHRNATGMN